MTNPIATVPTAQANTASGIASGIAGAQGDLASAETTFADFLMAHLGGMNVSEGDLNAIQQDLSEGVIDKNSPLFNILGQITEQFNLIQDANGLSAENQLFIRELAGLFIDLNAEGDLNLSADIVNQLKKISDGELPAEDFISLIEDTDLFSKLRVAIKDEDVSGLVKSTEKPEDIHEKIIESIKTKQTHDQPVENAEVVIKRLTNLLENIHQRLEGIENPGSEKALNELAKNISNLIAHLENKLSDNETLTPELALSKIVDDLKVTLNGGSTTTLNLKGDETIDGLIARPDVISKVPSNKKAALLQAQANTGQTGGVTIHSTAAANAKKSNAQSFSLASVGLNADGSFLSSIDANGDFSQSFDVRGGVADSLQNALNTTKPTAQQSARTLLPPSPAVQQVLVHIQKNAQNQSRMNIQLHPAELGRVEVHLTVNNDGRTTARVLADRSETLQLLQKDSAHLEKALQNAGLDVGAKDLSFDLRGDGHDGFKKHERFARRGSHNNEDLSTDRIQLSGAALDSAVFSKYRVNYKA